MTTSIYTKKCTKCNEIKYFDEYVKDRRAKDGLKECCKKCNKQWRIDNKEHIKQYRIDNKEHIKKQKKQYNKINKEVISHQLKTYRHSFALYETYAHQLTVDEEPRLAADGVSLEVRCKYCGKYFKPTNNEVRSRCSAINGNESGEHALYCSTNCKKSCGTYGQIKYPKGFKTDTSREVQPALRKLVLERDNWTCQTCEATTKTQPLHCHHYEGIEINPIESADVDNCITLCKSCHNKLHKDCNMRRKKCLSN